MKTTTKIAAIVAVVLILLGLTLACISSGIIGNDMTQLNTVTLTQTTHTIAEPFENIRIHTSVGIQILPASGSECTVVCDDSENQYHAVSVENGTLVVKQITEHQMMQFNVMIMENPSVTVYLPESQYEDLSIDGSSGDIMDVDPSFTFRNVQLKVSSGSIRFRANLVNDLTVSTSSGDILLENVHADAIRTTATSGSITLSGCEAQQDISVQTSSGDIHVTDTKAAGSLHTGATSGQVELTDVTAMSMTGKSSSGDLQLYNVVIHGHLSLEATSGSISLDSSDAQSLVIQTSSGDVSGTLLSPKFFITHTSSGSVKTSDPDPAGGRCEITTSSGNIKMTAK